MNKTKLILVALVMALAFATGLTTAAVAQPQPYCGPNPPAGDTYGVPFSGSAAARAGARACQHKAARYGHHGWRHHSDYDYGR